MNRSCQVCGRRDLDQSWVELTISPVGKDDCVHTYCPECATRYLDTLDMFGMTLVLVKAIRTAHAA